MRMYNMAKAIFYRNGVVICKYIADKMYISILFDYYLLHCAREGSSCDFLKIAKSLIYIYVTRDVMGCTQYTHIRIRIYIYKMELRFLTFTAKATAASVAAAAENTIIEYFMYTRAVLI